MSQLELADILVFSVPPLASSLALAVAHWFPWHGGVAQLKRTTAYGIGTSFVVGVPVLAMALTALLGMHYSQWFWAALLVANTVASGVTVHLAYWIDGSRAVTLDEVSDAAAGR